MFYADQRLRRAPLFRSLLALAVVLSAVDGSLADEPASTSQSQSAYGLPSLSRIPYVNRLFKNEAVATNDDSIERVGVDFEIVGPDAPFVTTSVFDLSMLAACHACCDEAAPAKTSKTDEGDCDRECCRHACCPGATAHVKGTSELWNRLVEMAVERTAMESAVEAQAAMMEGRIELLAAMSEMATKVAKVEARLELQAERDEMIKQVIELTTKNTRLEVQLEMAEAKVAMMQQMMKLTLENEQLKEKIANLSRSVTPDSEAPRISSQPTVGQRRR